MIHCWPVLVIHDFELTTECDSASMVAQDKSCMKMITLTKQDYCQINSLQIRFLPSMTVCYSLDVSLVSCLVQTKINMEDNYDSKGVENLKSLVSHLCQLLDLHKKQDCRLSRSVFEKVCLL
ncbi:kinetochore-associated protein 1-like [Labrus mixtus]|uniref:kinetochore-associated protein 1-like n=1 Tax=Labrus mixtus TaxID=508554 RepID=UPI0029C056A8|nr:kinetochore-associated protein 1-like [Labrus mixtus]